jgi:hypothetical protein
VTKIETTIMKVHNSAVEIEMFNLYNNLLLYLYMTVLFVKEYVFYMGACGSSSNSSYSEVRHQEDCCSKAQANSS